MSGPEQSKSPAGEPSDIDDTAVKRNMRLLTGVIVGFGVLAFAAGVIVAALNPHHHGHGHRSVLGAVAGVSVVVLVVVVEVIWLRRMFRTSTYRRLMQYGWRQRRRVGKVLRKGHPVSEQDWPVATSIVAVTRRQAWTMWVMPAAVALWGVQAFTHHGFIRWLFIAAAIFGVVALPFWIKQRRAILTAYDRQLADHHA